MKTKILTISIIAMTLISCYKGKDEELTMSGTWKLTEVLADPGDGSGTFNPVNSNKTLTFNSNGMVTSNGEICSMSVESNKSSTGTFTETNFTIQSSYCPDITIGFKVIGNELILTYPCIEPCRLKFIKVP